MEVQYLQCKADNGTFTLKFRQAVSASLPYNASSTDIKNALEALPTLTKLSVTFLYDDIVWPNNTVIPEEACNTSGTTFIRVSFDTIHGNLPPLHPDTSILMDDTNENGRPGTGTINVAVDGESIGGYASIKGTTENAFCNNRGICDFSSGVCNCFENWGSSDGEGNVGDRGDCGYRIQFNSNGGKIPVNKAKRFQKTLKG